MPKYEVEIPGAGVFEVESDKPLTDAQAYSFAMTQASQQKSKKDATEEKPIERAIGLVGRAITPTVTGASLGSRFGPVGALVGSAALPIGDLLNTILNVGYEPLTGKRLQMPSQIVQSYLTQAGVPAAPETQTPTEKVISAGLTAGTSVPQQVKAFTTLATQAATPIGKALAEIGRAHV